MKGSGLFSYLSLLLLFFLSSSSAWPWPESFGQVGQKVDALVRRQDNNNNDNNNDDDAAASSTARSSASATNNNDDDEDAAASSTAAGSGSASRSASASVTDSPSSKNSTTTKTSHNTTAIDPRLPAGGISLITPAPIDGIQFYKVGDFVTFKWNYTSLSVTPSAIDVLASCAVNQQTYTISSNMSVEETGAITWDTGDYQATATDPLLVASYTLIVHDAAKDVTDIPSAGYLGAYAQYVFGMYTGQPYVPLNEFKCATCNGALSIHEKQALGVLLTTVAITIMSFTWFANGFGVF